MLNSFRISSHTGVIFFFLYFKVVFSPLQLLKSNINERSALIPYQELTAMAVKLDLKGVTEAAMQDQLKLSNEGNKVTTALKLALRCVTR